MGGQSCDRILRSSRRVSNLDKTIGTRLKWVFSEQVTSSDWLSLFLNFMQNSSSRMSPNYVRTQNAPKRTIRAISSSSFVSRFLAASLSPYWVISFLCFHRWRDYGARLAYVLHGFFTFISFSLPYVRKHKADGTILHGRPGVTFSSKLIPLSFKMKLWQLVPWTEPRRRSLTLGDQRVRRCTIFLLHSGDDVC